MLHYEFACRSCKKVFSQMLTPGDHDEGDFYSLKVGSREDEVCCPHCGSMDFDQRWSAFDALAPSKAA